MSNCSSGKKLKVAVIGGGAAGFFAAISVKTHHPDSSVTIYEKTSKLLAKVKISGGGRCNVTNGTSSIAEVSRAYPRGAKLMKRLLREFNTVDTRQWFEDRGVSLKIENDGRVFPISDDSQTIIDCLMEEVKMLDIRIEMNSSVSKIEDVSDAVLLLLKEDAKRYDRVIIATGGHPKLQGFNWLKSLDISIVEPVPSLFTFNMPNEPITKLMGVVAPEAIVSIQGAKLKSSGPLLITHWGMSGPAILKLSAFGARDLFETEYQFKAQINWIGILNNDKVLTHLVSIKDAQPKKQLSSIKPFGLPSRLWNHLVVKAGLEEEKPWQELGKKSLNKLTTLLTNDVYDVSGKTTFKEEFVTCGGVSLSSIDHQTLQSKKHPNIYFAGEVLDVDGITGGYNFQAAWASGFVAGRLGE